MLFNTKKLFGKKQKNLTWNIVIISIFLMLFLGLTYNFPNSQYESFQNPEIMKKWDLKEENIKEAFDRARELWLFPEGEWEIMNHELDADHFHH